MLEYLIATEALWGPPNIKEVEVRSEDLENKLVTCIVCSFMCGLVNWLNSMWCIMCFIASL